MDKVKLGIRRKRNGANNREVFERLDNGINRTTLLNISCSKSMENQSNEAQREDITRPFIYAY